MNGAKLICASLEERGVSHVFGLPGTQNVMLYEALRTSGLRSISASDEGAAAFMATGYAKASGHVGVLTTIPGPGFVYALAGIVEAQHDSIPLLWVTLRQADNTRAFQLQRIDQAAMAQPVVKRCMQVERATNSPARCWTHMRKPWQASLGRCSSKLHPACSKPTARVPVVRRPPSQPLWMLGFWRRC